MGKRIQVGDKRWNTRFERWQSWSGMRWLAAEYSSNRSALRAEKPLDSWPRVTPQLRVALVDDVICAEVAAGSNVLHQGQHHILFRSGRRVNHLSHFILAFLTAGAWLLVWLLALLAAGEKRYRIDVDPWGHAWRSEL